MIELNKNYRIYGKMGKMKKMQPVSGSDFVTSLMHAEIFSPKSEEETNKLQRELDFLNTQGVFELRLVSSR